MFVLPLLLKIPKRVGNLLAGNNSEGSVKSGSCHDIDDDKYNYKEAK